MKKIFLCCSLAIMIACSSNKQNQEEGSTAADSLAVDTTSKISISLVEKWKTDTTSLITPEAVIFDSARNVLYVSCIGNVPPDKKDGDGYIAKLGLDGKIITKNWVKGFSGPKGLGVVGNSLYVTDIDRIVEIDIEKGKIAKEYKIKDALFLNDIATDSNGDVYASDSYANKIHKISGGKLEEWIKDDSLGNPNGLLVQGDVVYMVSFGKGEFFKFGKNDKSITKISGGVAQGDGLVAYKDGFIQSGWGGTINYLTPDGKTTELLNTSSVKVNSADIWYIPGANLLLVPTFFKNSVVAYEVK